MSGFPHADPRLTLGRGRRLRGARTFALVRKEGRRRVCGCLIMNWRRMESPSPAQLGVVTGRRIGGAVVRNRARRLIREAFRMTQHHIRPSTAVVLVARASMADRSLSEVAHDLESCLRGAGLWTEPES